MLRCCPETGSTGPGSGISNDDDVIVYIHRDSMQAVKVDQHRAFDCKFGRFPMKDWISKKFGSKVFASDGKGFLYLLAPTPELWTQVLRHRTQILYAADISLIALYLELSPGSVVLESGTGSGSLTHALARCIAPGGHVHTFEFHAERVAEACKEFLAHGLGSLVSIQERDIEKLGFPEALRGRADGVFLDLPGPWKVVESASMCLRGDGVFCAFSPCIEQVQRTCGALSQNGFYNIRTMECLLRTYEFRSTPLLTDVFSPTPLAAGQKRKRGSVEAGDSAVPQLLAKPMQEARGHTGFLTFARRIVEEKVPGTQPESAYPSEEQVDETLVCGF